MALTGKIEPVRLWLWCNQISIKGRLLTCCSLDQENSSHPPNILIFTLIMLLHVFSHLHAVHTTNQPTYTPCVRAVTGRRKVSA